MVEICGPDGKVHFRLPDGDKELELKIRALLKREAELEAAVEAERERVEFLLEAIAAYLYKVQYDRETALAEAINLSRASHNAGSLAFDRRGMALYDLFKGLEAMGADSLSLEVLAAFQAARHVWYR